MTPLPSSPSPSPRGPRGPPQRRGRRPSPPRPTPQPAEISRFLERLQKQEEQQQQRIEARVLPPSADEGCLLWRVEAKRGSSSVAAVVVALSPPDNASINSPLVPLGLASVELKAAAASASAAAAGVSLRGDDGDDSGGDGNDGAGNDVAFESSLLFDGDKDERLEALAAAVEEFLSLSSSSL